MLWKNVKVIIHVMIGQIELYGCVRENKFDKERATKGSSLLDFARKSY